MSKPKNRYKNQRRKRKKHKKQDKTAPPLSTGMVIVNYTVALLSLLLLLFLLVNIHSTLILYSDDNTLQESGTCVSIRYKDTFGTSKSYYYIITLDSGNEFFITMTTSSKAGYSFEELQNVLLHQNISIRYALNTHFNFPLNEIKQLDSNGNEIFSYDDTNDTAVSNRIGVGLISAYLLLMTIIFVFVKPIGHERQRVPR